MGATGEAVPRTAKAKMPAEPTTQAEAAPVAPAATEQVADVAYSIVRHDHNAGAVVIAVNRSECTVPIPRGTDSAGFYQILAKAAREFAAKGTA